VNTTDLFPPHPSWFKRPTTPDAFDKLMTRADVYLAKAGYRLYWRPVCISRWITATALIFSDKPTEWLVGEWFGAMYGKRREHDYISSAPIKWNGTLWLVNIPFAHFGDEFPVQRKLHDEFGWCNNYSEQNCLAFVESLTSMYAAKLSHSQLTKFERFFHMGAHALSWLADLASSFVPTNFFRLATVDYRQSTRELMLETGYGYPASRAATQLAVERVLKGLLELQGWTPDELKKAADHSLTRLMVALKHRGWETAERTKTILSEPKNISLPLSGIEIPRQLISAAECNDSIRYGQSPTTVDEALLANHAALKIFSYLQSSAFVVALTKRYCIRTGDWRRPASTSEISSCPAVQ
jgi:hypothetical protein